MGSVYLAVWYSGCYGFGSLADILRVKMPNQQGTLYVVATPIGNLEDLSSRARKVLASVDRIAAEDTRHSGPLLKHFGIKKPMVSLHEHNEREQAGKLVEKLCDGESIALISDAGTPLISDPGYHLIHAAHQSGIQVLPIPGSCAFVAALSVSGLPTDRFVFEGFLPNRSSARKKCLSQFLEETRTLVFYESCHRIVASVYDMQDVFGQEREAVIARELTKKFETVKAGNLAQLLEWLQSDENQQKGEFVVMIHGANKRDKNEVGDYEKRVLQILLAELPVKQASLLASQLTGVSRNLLYKKALERDSNDSIST